MPAIVHEVVVEIDHQEVAWEQLSSMSPEELDRDLKLDTFFGISYVINLPHAQERLKRVTADLHRVGLKTFQVWKGTNGRNPQEVPEEIWSKMYLNWLQHDTSTANGLRALQHQFKGEAGCFLSHYRLLCFVQKNFKEAMQELAEASDPEKIAEATSKARKYSSVLIMEDDNGFGFVDADNFKIARMDGVGQHLREAMTELPHDWDMLYFMAQSHHPALPFTPHLKQLRRGTLLNAYAVSYRMYDAIIAQLQQIEDPDVYALSPVDEEIANLHLSHNCYAITPSIAYQREGTSQIVGWTFPELRQLQP